MLLLLSKQKKEEKPKDALMILRKENKEKTRLKAASIRPRCLLFFVIQRAVGVVARFEIIRLGVTAKGGNSNRANKFSRPP